MFLLDSQLRFISEILFLACFAGCLSGTCGPIFRGILSKTVGTDEQGENTLCLDVSNVILQCLSLAKFVDILYDSVLLCGRVSTQLTITLNGQPL